MKKDETNKSIDKNVEAEEASAKSLVENIEKDFDKEFAKYKARKAPIHLAEERLSRAETEDDPKHLSDEGYDNLFQLLTGALGDEIEKFTLTFYDKNGAGKEEDAFIEMGEVGIGPPTEDWHLRETPKFEKRDKEEYILGEINHNPEKLTLSNDGDLEYMPEEPNFELDQKTIDKLRRKREKVGENNNKHRAYLLSDKLAEEFNSKSKKDPEIKLNENFTKKVVLDCARTLSSEHNIFAIYDLTKKVRTSNEHLAEISNVKVHDILKDNFDEFNSLLGKDYEIDDITVKDKQYWGICYPCYANPYSYNEIVEKKEDVATSSKELEKENINSMNDKSILSKQKDLLEMGVDPEMEDWQKRKTPEFKKSDRAYILDKKIFSDKSDLKSKRVKPNKVRTRSSPKDEYVELTPTKKVFSNDIKGKHEDLISISKDDLVNLSSELKKIARHENEGCSVYRYNLNLKKNKANIFSLYKKDLPHFLSSSVNSLKAKVEWDENQKRINISLGKINDKEEKGVIFKEFQSHLNISEKELRKIIANVSFDQHESILSKKEIPAFIQVIGKYSVKPDAIDDFYPGEVGILKCGGIKVVID